MHNSTSLSDFGVLNALGTIVPWAEPEDSKGHVDSLLRWIYMHINPMNSYDSKHARNIDAAVVLLCSLLRTLAPADFRVELRTIFDGFCVALNENHNLSLFRYTRSNAHLSSCIRSARHFLMRQLDEANRVASKVITTSPRAYTLPVRSHADTLPMSSESESDHGTVSSDDDITLPDVDCEDANLPGTCGLNLDMYRLFSHGSDIDLFLMLSNLDARLSVSQMTDENRKILTSILGEVQQRSSLYSPDQLSTAFEWFICLTTH